MKKKLIALLLAVLMMASLLPLTALAAHPEECDHTTDACQIDKFGGVNYYDEYGENEGVDVTNFVVSTSKTVEATEKENEFKINLEVKTTQLVTEDITPPDVATVLVIDISSSMKWKVDGSTLNADDRGTLWGNDNLAESINYAKYIDGTSRMARAKVAARDFLDSYIADANGAARWVSIVSFGTQATIEQTWVDITDPDNLALAQAAIDALYVYNDTKDGNGTQYTYLQGGLGLAQNLISANGINELDNRFVITLTDGSPTYSKASLSNDSGKTATGATITGGATNGSAASGEDAVEYNANVRVARERAEAVAADIKSSGAKIYTVGLSLDENRKFNNYATTSPKATGDVQKNATEWLTEYVASPATESDIYHFDAGSENALKLAFGEISKNITQIWARAWIVTDPMGANIVWNASANDVDDWTYTFSGEENTLSWNLRRDEAIESEDSARPGVTIYTYTYSYFVKLDTLAEGFIAEELYDTNEPTTLTYRTITTTNGNVELGELQTVDFEIPEVHGYAADLHFVKVDGSGKTLEGAAFSLTLGEFKMFAESDDDGIVSFVGIPSGHVYTLVETQAPERFDLDETGYIVTVSYGDLTIAPEPDEDGSFYIADEQLYFENTSSKIEQKSGDLMIQKTVDGELFGDWYFDGNHDVDPNLDLDDISFELYKVTGFGADIDDTAELITNGVIDVFTSYISFGTLDIEAGWYAVVEVLSGKASDYFEQVEPQYFYIGKVVDGSNVTYNVGGGYDFDPDDDYYVDYYEWVQSGGSVLLYTEFQYGLIWDGTKSGTGTAADGQLNEVQNITARTSKDGVYKEYNAFCAHVGSWAYSGNSYDPYVLDVDAKANILSAFNYIYDEFGSLDGWCEGKDFTEEVGTTATKVLAQLAVWYYIPEDDDTFKIVDIYAKDPRYNAINAAWEDVKNAVDSKYKGTGSVVELFYLIDYNADSIGSSQPQIIPIIAPGKFENKTTTTTKVFGSATFVKLVEGDKYADFSAFEFELFMYDADEDDYFPVDPSKYFQTPGEFNHEISAWDLEPGFYVFKEVLPTGWTNNFPDGLFFEIRGNGAATPETIWLLGDHGIIIPDVGDTGPDFVNTKIVEPGSLTIDADAELTVWSEKYIEQYKTERFPYLTLLDSGGTVTATNLETWSKWNANPKFDKKNNPEFDYIVPNSNHFTYSAFTMAELQAGVELAMVVGNKIDQVGTAFVKYVNGMIEIEINGFSSGDVGAVAFTNLKGVPNNGNIHSMNKEKDMQALGAAAGVTRFDHDNKLKIPCPVPSKATDPIYLYIHSGSMSFDVTSKDNSPGKDYEWDEVNNWWWGPWSAPVKTGEKKVENSLTSVTELLALALNLKVTSDDGTVVYDDVYTTNSDALILENLSPGDYTIEWSWTYPGGDPAYDSDSQTITIAAGENKSFSIPTISIDQVVVEKDYSPGTAGIYDDGIDELDSISNTTARYIKKSI